MASEDSKYHVLLTGATGFLGKVVLEELLRRRDELKIDKIILVIRDKGPMSAATRFKRYMRRSLCFSLLPKDWTRHVEVVSGNLAHDACGLHEADYHQLGKRITHVIHCAASVEFDLPIEQACSANITSSLNVLAWAQSCLNLQKMVSVSTAYVTPHRWGPIPEALVDLPEPAEKMYEDILTGRAHQADMLAAANHPNTYTLTKCIAEHLQMQRRAHVPLSIVRPSIISASWKQPFKGWIDSHAAFASFVTTIGAGSLRVVDAHPSVHLDIVPVDEVATRILEQALMPSYQTSEARMVHAVSGMKRSLPIEVISQKLVDYFQRYPVGYRSCLKYMGPRGRRYLWKHGLYHDLPAVWQQVICSLQGDRRGKRRAKLMMQKLAYLNRVFAYFTHRSFDFCVSRGLDTTFDLLSYIDTVCEGVYRYLLRRDPRRVVFAGRAHQAASSDIRWSMGLPRGPFLARMSAYFVRKALRRTFDKVSLDQVSFEKAMAQAGQAGEERNFIIIPTHRSYMDFVICSYIFFTHPSLGIPLPHVAAAQEFSRIPVVSWFFKKLHALYLQRGTGQADLHLNRQIHDLIARHHAFEFFIEGTRSRSRQFLPPRRGLLRCLQASGARFAILPVSISYDRVAEEASLLQELQGHPKAPMRLSGLMAWVGRMFKNQIKLGCMHIRCGAPLTLDSTTDIPDISQRIMAQLQKNMAVSTWHLQTFLEAHPQSQWDLASLQAALEARGAPVIDSTLKKPDPHLSSAIERSFQRQWSHVFLKEACLSQPGNLALKHYMSENGYAAQAYPQVDAIPHVPLGLGSASELERAPAPSWASLFFCLFEPICADYAAVAKSVKRWLGKDQVVAAQHILSHTMYRDYPTAQSALRALVAGGYLVAVDGMHYKITGKASDFSAFIEQCAWRTGAHALQAPPQAVGT